MKQKLSKDSLNIRPKTQPISGQLLQKECLQQYMQKFLKKPAHIPQIKCQLENLENQINQEVLKLQQMIQQEQFNIIKLRQMHHLTRQQNNLASQNMKKLRIAQQKKTKKLIKSYQYESGKLKNIEQTQQKCLRIRYSENPKQFIELLTNRLVCPYNEFSNVQFVCVYQKCNKHAFICNQRKCRCKKQHQNCRIIPVSRFMKRFKLKLVQKLNKYSIQYYEAKYLIYQYMSDRISEQQQTLKKHFQQQRKQDSKNDIVIYGYDNNFHRRKCPFEQIWRKGQIDPQIPHNCYCTPLNIGKLSQKQLKIVLRGYDMLLDKVFSFMADLQSCKISSSLNAADRIILRQVANQQKFLDKKNWTIDPIITGRVIRASIQFPDAEKIGPNRSFLKDFKAFWVNNIVQKFELLVSLQTCLIRQFINTRPAQGYQEKQQIGNIEYLSDQILLQKLENINKSLEKFEDQVLQHNVPLNKWKHKDVVVKLYKVLEKQIFCKNMVFRQKGDKRFQIVIQKKQQQNNWTLNDLWLQLRQKREKQNLKQSIYITLCKGSVTAIRLYHFPIFQKAKQELRMASASEFIKALKLMFPSIHYFYYFCDNSKMFKQVALNKQFIDQKIFDQFLESYEQRQLLQFKRLKNIIIQRDKTGDDTAYILKNQTDATIKTFNQNIQIHCQKMRNLHLTNVYSSTKITNIFNSVCLKTIIAENCQGVIDAHLAHIYETSPNLKGLMINKCPNLSGYGISRLKSLNMLKIEQVPLQQKKALEIINSLKDVQFLDISRNSWLSDSLLDELGKNFKKLKYLNIRQNKIGSKGLQHLKHFKNLKTLICGRGQQSLNQCNTYHGRQILKLTENLPNLERLSMDYIQLQNDLLLRIDLNIHLTHLNVKGCGYLKAEQMVHMANLRYVVMWPPLKLLSRSFNAANLLRQKGVKVCQIQ